VGVLGRAAQALADDLARSIRVQDLPDKEMRLDLPSGLLLVGGVGPLDVQLPVADRAHGKAGARVVGAQLLAQRGV
jgi:hypothetical protein